MARRRGARIEVDLTEYIGDFEDDVIEEEFRARKLHLKVPDDVIEEEFRARKLHLKVPNEPDAADAIREAYENLLINRPAEARAILERIVRPKWNSVRQCENEFAAALSSTK